ANECEAIMQTVGDCERMGGIRFLEDPRSANERERNPLFQFRTVDPMGELNRRYDLLCRRFTWVLVELGFLDRGAKVRRARFELITLQAHVRGEKSLLKGDAV